jgi:hypothetical protein
MAEAAASGGFAPIAIVYSLPEASVLIATLSAYGFAAVTLNQGTISVDPHLMLALGGIAVAVAPEQYDDAIALLEEIDGGWTLPPNPLAEDDVANGALAAAMAVFGVVGAPRLRGRYAWRTGQGVRPADEAEPRAVPPA